MKRRVLGISLVVALVAIVAVGATLAYFTDSTNVVQNTFTMGNVDIRLDEKDNTQTDGSRTERGNEYTGVTPGVALAKDPTVWNIGANDAWVRVNVTVSKAKAWETALTKHGITDLATIFGEHDEDKWTRARIAEDAINDTITYSYYYNAVVPGKTASKTSSTEALFTTVTIPAVFDNDDVKSIDGFKITITADAIQTDASFTTAAQAFEAFDAAKIEADDE